MRHGVLFYEAMGLIYPQSTFSQGVLFYEATRHSEHLKIVLALPRNLEQYEKESCKS